MPRVHKTHRYEAVRMGHDVTLINDKTPAKGKTIEHQGRYQITDLDSGDQWYVTHEEFIRSGWAPVDPADAPYYERGPDA